MLGERKLAVPAAGLRVMNPETGRPLPAEGEAVTVSVFWARRARDRDVVLSAVPRNVDAQPSAPADEPAGGDATNEPGDQPADEAPKRGRRNDR